MALVFTIGFWKSCLRKMEAFCTELWGAPGKSRWRWSRAMSAVKRPGVPGSILKLKFVRRFDERMTEAKTASCEPYFLLKCTYELCNKYV